MLSRDKEIKIRRISQNPKKYKNLKEIFEIEPEAQCNNNNKLKYDYNKKIFFNPATNNNQSKEDPQPQELNKIINNVINSTITNNNQDKNESIKLNLNIKNNFYNSTQNNLTKKEETKMKCFNGKDKNTASSNESKNEPRMGVNNFTSKIHLNLKL